MSKRIPLVVLAVIYIAFTAHLMFTLPQLPERVATHFDAAGHPNGWMSRTSHVLFMAAFGYVFPLAMTGVFFVARYLPASTVNIPHRDHWLAPERRGETFEYLFRHSLWFACLLALFALGINHLLFQANRSPTHHASTVFLMGLALMFFVGLVAWLIPFVRRFNRISPPTK